MVKISKKIWQALTIIGILLLLCSIISMHIHCWGKPYGLEILVYLVWYDWVMWGTGVVLTLGASKKL